MNGLASGCSRWLSDRHLAGLVLLKEPSWPLRCASGLVVHEWTGVCLVVADSDLYRHFTLRYTFRPQLWTILD